MRNVARIIEQHGGMEALKRNGEIVVKNDPYMDLHIEWVAKDSNGNDVVSVAHYFTQNGDLMSDPEMTFAVFGESWQPLTYTLSSMGIYQEAIYEDENEKRMIRPKLERQLLEFARTWDQNIGEQGFVKTDQTEVIR